ncbi:MAG: cell division protein FtsZ [Candidatus Nealsonbacteria bacterium]|nr:cell division protein FtsZ [Candidatus Nealsonbacteria bacterium]
MKKRKAKSKKIHSVRYLAKRNNFAKAKLFKKVNDEKTKEIKIEIPAVIREDTKNKDDVHRTKIRIIGIGGGGGSIVSEITSRVKKADFVIANTDSRALKDPATKAKKFQFGYELTKGLGTGMNVLVGEAAALADKDRIAKLLKDHDLCIIIASLGGGTSSGASPIFAKISRDLGNLTYGIFTLPFKFEGEKKMEAARESLEKIRPYLNIYSVIPNEKIFEIVDRNTPLKDALSAINKKLADNLEGLIEMIYTPGLINIDFADLKTVLSGRGRLAYLNTVKIEQAERENKEEIIKKVIHSSLYPYTPKGAKGILYNLGDSKNIQLAEVSQISNTILQFVNKDAKIIFGINQSQKPNPKLTITLLATGCIGRDFFEKPGQVQDSSDEAAEKIKEKPALPRKLKIIRKKEPKLNKKSVGIKTAPKKIKAKKPGKKAKSKKEKKIRKRVKRTIVKKISNAEKESQKSPANTKIITKKPAITKIISKKAKNKKKIHPVKSGKAGSPSAKFSRARKQARKTEKKEIMVPIRKEPALPLVSEPQATKVTVANLDSGLKVRKNALQLRKEIEDAEKKLIEKEKIWDIPAILRKKRP